MANARVPFCRTALQKLSSPSARQTVQPAFCGAEGNPTLTELVTSANKEADENRIEQTSMVDRTITLLGALFSFQKKLYVPRSVIEQPFWLPLKVPPKSYAQAVAITPTLHMASGYER
jgi:hypothetical protein